MHWKMSMRRVGGTVWHAQIVREWVVEIWRDYWKKIMRPDTALIR